MILDIKDLSVRIGEKDILDGVNFSMQKGEFHVIMGPNGCGKSTFLSTIISSPFSKVTNGSIFFNGIEIGEFSTDQRARMGIFLAFQNPVSIPGLTVGRFLKKLSDLHSEKTSANFVKELREKMDLVGLNQSFINRYLGDGFSGGEKKKLEILQILLIKPKLIMLDEIDSGLDMDSVKLIFSLINQINKEGTSVLLVSHYKEVFNHINPNRLHIMKDGKMIANGDKNMVELLDKHGYSYFEDEKS